MTAFLNYKNLKISFESCCTAGNKRWFFLNEFNALCNMDISSKHINFVGMVPGEGIFSKYLFADIKHYKDCLILIPRDASAIVVYSISDNNFRRIAINEPDIPSSNAYFKWLKFSSSVIINENIYLIPRTYPGIVEMNLKTYQIKYFNTWIKDIDKLIFENEAFFWSDCAVEKDNIILAASNADYLLKFNVKTKKYVILNLENNNNGFSAIEIFQNGYLLTSRKDGTLKFLDQSNILRDFGGMPEGFKVDKIIGYSKLIRIGSTVYAIPLWANMLLRIDEKSGQITCVKNYESERNGNTEVAVCCSWVEDNLLYCYNNILKRLEYFSTENHITPIELCLTKSFYEKMEREIKFNLHPVSTENELFSLNNFLSYVQRENHNITIKKESSIGGRIHKKGLDAI